jgi:periplasmic protein TonB
MAGKGCTLCTATDEHKMTTDASTHAARFPRTLRVMLRGVLLAAGAAFLLAGCGRSQNAPPKPAPAPPAAATAAKHPRLPAPTSAPAAAVPAAPAAGSTSAQAQQAQAARARLAAMSVDQLLAAAREAVNQQRLLAPASDNAFEYYEAALAKDPRNQVAADALRETFPFGATQVERTIGQNNFDEAGREIDLLAKADPTNYTLTILRSKLDAQRKQFVRQQQLQAQRAAELAAQQAAAAKAAAEQAAAAEEAARKAAAAKAAPPPPPKPVAEAPKPPPKPAAVTRAVQVVNPAAPSYPIEAARNQISGYAVVEFTVNPDGSVGNAHVVDSSPRRVFDQAAIEAVKRSQFKPAMKNGEPVASVLRRRIDFKF